VGARAYAAGQYGDAIQAFQRAYQLTPREGLLFSLAQAHRKQYHAAKQPEDLRAAVKLYREYLDRVKQGARRADAMDALVELEPRAAALEPAGPTPAPTVETKPTTQIMVSSAAAGVRIEIDGRAVGLLPYVGAVEPGKHRIRLSAPGYEDYSRDISLLAGSVVPLDIPMVDKPARLLLRAPAGARVTIDGREVGVAPLAPLRLSHGRHFVSVSKNGREPFAQDVELERGRSRELDARLPATSQRTAAWVVLGTAGTACVTSGLLALVAARKESDAEAILARSERRNISSSELDSYLSLRDERDDYRTASLVAAATGGGLAALGTLLFVFDEARAEQPKGPELRPGSPHKPAPGADLSAAVTWTPMLAGATLTGRF